MKDLNIEEIIINNFYKMIEDEKYQKETVQNHIKEIEKGLEIIKQNGNLEILKLLYIIKQNLYEELNKANQVILVKGMFNDITPAIIFALGYKKACYRIQIQSENETNKNIVLEVPTEIKDKVINLINANYKYLNNKQMIYEENKQDKHLFRINIK